MKELLIKYPKAAKVVKDYYLEKFLKSLDDKNLPEDFKEHCRQQGLQEGMIEEVLENNPRSLLDVFDFRQIHITVYPFYIENITKFSWYMGGERADIIDRFDTRIEAEKAAISKAFELLEEKL